jgi:hypothetical protein
MSKLTKGLKWGATAAIPGLAGLTIAPKGSSIGKRLGYSGVGAMVSVFGGLLIGLSYACHLNNEIYDNPHTWIDAINSDFMERSLVSLGVVPVTPAWPVILLEKGTVVYDGECKHSHRIVGEAIRFRKDSGRYVVNIGYGTSFDSTNGRVSVQSVLNEADEEKRDIRSDVTEVTRQIDIARRGGDIYRKRKLEGKLSELDREYTETCQESRAKIDAVLGSYSNTLATLNTVVSNMNAELRPSTYTETFNSD